jgi:hypothetical protein
MLVLEFGAQTAAEILDERDLRSAQTMAVSNKPGGPGSLALGVRARWAWVTARDEAVLRSPFSGHLGATALGKSRHDQELGADEYCRRALRHWTA